MNKQKANPLSKAAIVLSDKLPETPKELESDRAMGVTHYTEKAIRDAGLEGTLKPDTLIVPPSLEFSWRDSLTRDDLVMIDQARDYAERWTGVQNNSPLILIARLATLLDERK